MEQLLPSYTLREWCKLERVSRDTFYRLRRQGTAPAIMRVRSKILITHEAALAWRQARAADATREAA